MSINKKRGINLLLVFSLLLSVIAPNLTTVVEAAEDTTVIGSPEAPSLTIHKYEREPGGNDVPTDGTGSLGQAIPEGATALEGVEFTLTLKETFNSENNEWTDVADGRIITGTTDGDGEVVFDSSNDLELGRYEVQETGGPDHVILNPNTFQVDVPMSSLADGEQVLNYDVHIYPKNETILADGELIKTDEDGEVLEGVIFGLYDTEGEQQGEDLVTSSDGKIKVENLAAGKYYFQEKETVEGHALNTTEIHFTVKKSDATGQEIIVVWDDVEDFTTDGTVINYKQPTIDKDVEGSVSHSVDRNEEYQYNINVEIPNDINKYSNFVVTDELDSRLEFVSYDSEVDGVTLEEPVGQNLTWIIDPATVPSGQLITLTFTAKIDEDAVLDEGEVGIPNEAKLEFNNNQGQEGEKDTEPVIVIPEDGGFNIIKVDKADNDIKLAGAEFKLTRDEDGNNVVDATGTIIKVNGDSIGGNLENLATGINGEISIEGLTPGTYYLHETKAPIYVDEDGVEKPYRLLTKPVEVVITADATVANDVTVENSKSGWDLPTTGGMGTILFTLAGITLMGAALYLLTKKKKGTQS